jgi:hypothetical protein
LFFPSVAFSDRVSFVESFVFALKETIGRSIWCVCVTVLLFIIRGKARAKEVTKKRKHLDGCKLNERLNANTEGSKHLVYTGVRR